MQEARQLAADDDYRGAQQLLLDTVHEMGYPHQMEIARSGNPCHPHTANVSPSHPAFDIAITQKTHDPFIFYRRSLDTTSGEITVRWTVDTPQPNVSGQSWQRRLFVSDADDVVVMELAAPKGSSVDAEIRLEQHHTPSRSWARLEDDRKENEPPITFAFSATEDSISVIAAYDAGGEFGGIAKGFVTAGAAPGPAPACIDDLMASAYDGVVPPVLHQRMYEYGRHLLYSSARGDEPPHHFGLWNGSYYPGFFTQRTQDTNFQAMHWPALAGNMSECLEPYFAYIESLLDDWRHNARQVFGCGGVFANVYGTTNGRINIETLSELIWTAGAGWLAQPFYDYYLHTGDLDFLEHRVVPLLEQIATFYQEFLKPDANNTLHFLPSYSPENTPLGHPSRITIDATMDVAVAKEVLRNLCDSYAALGRLADAKPWAELLAHLPNYTTNEDGALCEWLHPDMHDNYSHRHISHLYPIFPGHEVTQESAPELLEAGRIAMEKRWEQGIDACTGWSYPYFACVFARIGDGNRALDCLNLLLRSSVGQNLLVYHNDWRAQGVSLSFGLGERATFIHIDGNMSYCAAIQEMLLQSGNGVISILPALPDAWPSGSVDGLLCRGGVAASIEWQPGHVAARLRSETDQTMTVRLPGLGDSLEVAGGSAEPSERGDCHTVVSLPAGVSVEITCNVNPSTTTT